MQTLDVGQKVMNALLMNEDWVKFTLQNDSQPCVINEETGQLEHYMTNGTFMKCPFEQNSHSVKRQFVLN